MKATIRLAAICLALAMGSPAYGAGTDGIAEFQNKFGFTPGIYVTCHVNFPEQCAEAQKNFKRNPDGYQGNFKAFTEYNGAYNIFEGSYNSYSIGGLTPGRIKELVAERKMRFLDRENIVFQDRLLTLAKATLETPPPIVAKETAKAKAADAKAKEAAEQIQRVDQANQDELESLTAKAEKGDAEAQFGLAILYGGDINPKVAQDPQKAWYWLEQAAEKKFIPALLASGLIYCSAEGFSPHPHKSAKALLDSEVNSGVADFLSKSSRPSPPYFWLDRVFHNIGQSIKKNEERQIKSMLDNDTSHPSYDWMRKDMASAVCYYEILYYFNAAAGLGSEAAKDFMESGDEIYCLGIIFSQASLMSQYIDMAGEDPTKRRNKFFLGVHQKCVGDDEKAYADAKARSEDFDTSVQREKNLKCVLDELKNSQ